MIYLDANVIIRLIEGLPAIKDPIVKGLAAERAMVTSQLSRLECRCQPLRLSNQRLLDLYDEFFRSTELIVLDINSQVIDRATQIRASTRFRTPDAIHLAAAMVAGTRVFLTGDVQLAQFSALTVETI